MLTPQTLPPSPRSLALLELATVLLVVWFLALLLQQPMLPPPPRSLALPVLATVLALLVPHSLLPLMEFLLALLIPRSMLLVIASLLAPFLLPHLSPENRGAPPSLAAATAERFVG